MSGVPLERYCKINRTIRFCVGICGNDVIPEDYRMWWLTYMVIGAIFFFFGCTVYTVYVGVVLEGDLTVILQAFAMVGSAVQGLTKLLVTARMAAEVRHIERTYESIYREYGQRGGDYSRCLERRIKTTWHMLMAFMWVYIVLVGGLIAYPFFFLIFYHEKTLVMQFRVPWIDESTDGGYLMLISTHVILLSFGGFGNFGGDMYLFLFITNVPTLKDIFNVKLQEFNAVVVLRKDYQRMKTQLWDLLAWHQQYVSILRATERIYRIILFVQLSTGCVSILCTISCIFIGAWPAAPIYLVYSFIGMYTFCGLGTIVENSNEDLTTEIYANCLWYELPVKEQKLVILMLAKSQHEISLTAADVMPLSMNTALQLTKGIYSFSMMMITYLGYEK
ncbi:odorant receptor 67d [Drosophila guanche]|uniref:Odorant receptor n=1 Tax=Drosophila guanche TaxID=7266 RepID=A0A3B0J4D5_DROGU|nr:odorant receptor 67d [Drosophila guanche]SPP76674.1 blast:Odorant receptor 67d [Drosophila guanche]